MPSKGIFLSGGGYKARRDVSRFISARRGILADIPITIGELSHRPYAASMISKHSNSELEILQGTPISAIQRCNLEGSSRTPVRQKIQICMNENFLRYLR